MRKVRKNLSRNFLFYFLLRCSFNNLALELFNCYENQSRFTTFGIRAVDPRPRNDGFDLDEDQARLKCEIRRKIDEFFDELQVKTVAHFNKLSEGFNKLSNGFEELSETFKEYHAENARFSESVRDLGVQIRQFVEEEENKVSEHELFDEMTETTKTPVDLSYHETPVKSVSMPLNSKVILQSSILLTPLAIDVVPFVMDFEKPNLVDSEDIKIVKKLGETIDNVEFVKGLLGRVVGYEIFSMTINLNFDPGGLDCINGSGFIAYVVVDVVDYEMNIITFRLWGQLVEGDFVGMIARFKNGVIDFEFVRVFGKKIYSSTQFNFEESEIVMASKLSDLTTMFEKKLNDGSIVPIEALLVHTVPSLDDDPWKRGIYLRVSDSLHSDMMFVYDEEVEFISSEIEKFGQFIYVNWIDLGSPVPVLGGINNISDVNTDEDNTDKKFDSTTYLPSYLSNCRKKQISIGPQCLADILEFVGVDYESKLKWFGVKFWSLDNAEQMKKSLKKGTLLEKENRKLGVNVIC